MNDSNITALESNFNKDSCVCTCLPLAELEETAQGVHYVVNITVSVITILTLIPGVMLNALILIAYQRNRHLQISSNKSLMALAITDWLVCAIVLPMYAAKKIAEIYTTFHCVLWVACRILPQWGLLASLTINGLISVEWFVTLAYPFRYQTIITEKRRQIIWAVSFVVTSLLPLPQMLQNKIRVSPVLYSTLIICFVLTITATWFWIHRLTLRHKRQIRQISASLNLERIVRNTKTCYLVVGSTMICFLPSFALLLCYTIMGHQRQALYRIIPPIFDVPLNMNSLVNPVILLYRKREFRQAVKQLIS